MEESINNEVLSESFKEAFELLKIDNKNFDFFDIIPPKEVLISKWIEFILNPELNGVGNAPVSKLVELIDSDIKIDEYEFISIDTEVTTDTLNRIDILIKYNGLWIVIENKIESYENDNQTIKYYNYIEKIKDNNQVIYIYLKPNYNGSIPCCNNFKTITYDSFINKLKEISEFEYTEKDKYKYLKEFIISGGRFMNNHEIEITDSLRFYLLHRQEFERIANEYYQKNRQVKNMIADYVIEALNENEDKYSKIVTNGTFIQFYKHNWKNDKRDGIHFEILFGTSDIIGKKLNAEVVLHIEKSISEEDLNRLESKGIRKVGTDASYYDNLIKENIVVDLTSLDNIKQSIDVIVRIIKNFANRYEEIIDSCFIK